MKTKLSISIILGLITLAFVYNNSEKEITQLPFTNPTGGQFLIGAMTDGWQANYSKLRDTLGFNMWHRYINGGMENGQFNIHGWTASDELNANINDYRTDIQGILGDNNTNGMRTLMERPKTTRLAFGERSDYQCEATHLNSDLWFYSYTNHPVGSDVYDNNATYGSNSWVRYCTNPANDPNASGWVVSGLRANREQVNMSDRWEGDRSYGWIVKPSIRMDKDFVNNPQNWLTPLCKIEVLNYDGNLIKSVILNARNFLDSNNTYDGKYKEEFRYFLNDSTLTFTQLQAVNFNPIQPDGTYRSWFVQDGVCHVDFKVYWYGACDMWIDYVRVDNNIADELFKGQHDNWLTWEATDIAQHTSSPYKFYIEEFEFNNIPCMSYVSRKLRSINPNIGLMCDLNYSNYNTMIPFSDWNNLPNVPVSHVKRYLIDSVGSSEIFMGAYPLAGFPPDGSFGQYSWSKIPNTLPCGNQSYNANTGMLTYSVSETEYENWLQTQLDETTVPYWSYRLWAGRADSLSKMAEIPFINIFQTHLWWGAGHRLKEPTNEEMEMMSNLALSYGARGIFYFWYEAFGNLPRASGDSTSGYARGLTNPVQTDVPNLFEVAERPSGLVFDARTQNVYGQNKWQKIIDINSHLKALGPTIMSFDNANRHSYIYRLSDERTNLTTQTYFADIKTYMPDPFNLDFPSSGADVPNSTYLQASVFNNPNDRLGKYFMLVNKRCSPNIENVSYDGKRYIKVKFNNDNHLPTFDTWKIYDVTDLINPVATFSKSANLYVPLGWYNPGEGKLYKMVPVIPTGGTLIADENISGTSFTCSGVVNSNGYNITIGSNTTIDFTDSACIVMNGGQFVAGNNSDHSTARNITFSSSNAAWDGLQFNNCSLVNISNCVFQNVKTSTTYDSVNYALKLADCYTYNISNNTFTNQSGQSSGAINSVFTGSTLALSNNVYIGYNTFDMNSSNRMIVKVQAFAGSSVSPLIENNTFTSGATSAGAIYLSNVYGIIKNNSVSGYYTGLNTLASSCDVFTNNMSSSLDGANSIYGASTSSFNMSAGYGDVITGGYNTITNEGSNAINVNVDNSYFNIDNGSNIFDIKTVNSGMHLYGIFPDNCDSKQNATNNCFKDAGNVINPPVTNLSLNGQPMNFTFDQYLASCTQSCTDPVAGIGVGNGVVDSLTSTCGGGGGSPGISQKHTLVLVSAPKIIYDSICIQMRKRNFGIVKSECNEMLALYPDSIQSLEAISKLYIATQLTDTTTAGKTALKTNYENLILNHASNTALVKKCNYLVQKCKVLLKMYTSALAGFQDIINSNQYNYDGLIARWDYMATTLLMNGQGGGESEISIDNEGIGIMNENTEYDEFDKFDEIGGDKSPFSKEQRKVIKESVVNSLVSSKESEEKKIEELTKLSNNGNADAKKLLNQKMTLKSIVKVQKPKNTMEHMKIVNSDIRRLYGQQNSGSNKNNNNLPAVFKLYQSYPNPFNPTATIKYDLPKDVKVLIKIYDILGREVKKLVDEFKKAGSYTVDFNGTNLASGVYFYRIEAGDFVQSKKMVLVK